MPILFHTFEETYEKNSPPPSTSHEAQFATLLWVRLVQNLRKASGISHYEEVDFHHSLRDPIHARSFVPSSHAQTCAYNSDPQKVKGKELLSKHLALTTRHNVSR